MNSGYDFCGFFGVSVLAALKLYYRRLSRNRHDVDSVCEIAAWMLLGNIIIQSQWYRSNHSQLKRANNIVIFEAMDPSW